MKQDRIKKTALFVGNSLAALLIFRPVISEAVQAYDVYEDSSGNPVVFETQGNRTYINIGGPVPTYDPASKSYHVSAVSGELVTAPDPVAVAAGDATNKTKVVGNEVVASIPGTDIVKLANGTYTNAQPSPLLAQTFEAQTDIPDSWQDTIHHRTSVSLSCGSLTPKTTPHGVTYADLCSVSADPVTGTITTVPGCFIPQDTLYNGMSCSGGVINFQTLYWSYKTNSWVVQDSKPVGSGFSVGIQMQMLGSAVPYMGNYTPDPGSEPVPPITPPTAEELAAALAPHLSNWHNNGLDNDLINAAKSGGNTTIVSGTTTTTTEINSWVTSNGGAVKDAISSGISSGFNTSIADGTNTGAQQQTSGQLSGIQDSLNGISDKLDDLKDDGKSYTPESQTNDYAPDAALNNTSEFINRFDSFVSAVKTTSLFSLPNQVLFNIPNSSTSTYTINMGSYGTADFDFSSFGSALTIFRTALLISFGYASIRIAAMGK